MISKELLSAVYSNFTIAEILNNRIDENIYYKIKEIDILQSINIHELAHKCKEWAWGKHLITVRSGYAEFGAWSNLANDNSVSFVSMDIPMTEPEAVFKACEWILENA